MLEISFESEKKWIIVNCNDLLMKMEKKMKQLNQKKRSENVKRIREIAWINKIKLNND
jgi:hypothetical protein